VGQTFKDRILVFPGAKGSSGWASNFQATRLAGSAPKAMVFCKISTKIALGVVVMRVPAVTDLQTDPFELIRTGDQVCVDGDRGLVIIRRVS
jgi:predicted aconitase with swiveling domain